MFDKFESGTDRGQTTAVVIGIAVFLLIGVIVASLFIFGGELKLDDDRTSVNTATSTETRTVTTRPIATPTTSPTVTKTPTPVSTATLTPALTETRIPTPTPTVTATPSPYANERYKDFVATVYGETEVDAELPIRTRGWTVLKGKELVIVMNLTAPSEDDIRRVQEVNTLVTSGYGQAVAHYDNGKIDGKIPNKLRIAEVNNTGSPPKTLYVNTSLVRKYYTGQLTAVEFSERYWSTETNMSDAHIEYIEDLDESAGNSTLYTGDSE